MLRSRLYPVATNDDTEMLKVTKKRADHNKMHFMVLFYHRTNIRSV